MHELQGIGEFHPGRDVQEPAVRERRVIEVREQVLLIANRAAQVLRNACSLFGVGL